MKKVIAILAASVLFAGMASAQGLGGLLGKLGGLTGNSGLGETISNVIYAYTGNTTAVALPGTWTYTGPAVALGGDDVLTNVAGTAASSTVESKVASYLEKYGITPGNFTITFNEDLTFSCTIKKVPISGTWKTLNDGNSVQLQFGKAMKYLSLTGALKGTANGCEVLFEGKKFLDFAKKALAIVGKADSTLGTVSSLAGNFSNMKIGCKLTKKN
ncbi:MAG: DUF4923 family protein [Bacteroidales bacterium]|nr:DUF4923 family protein [Bacteroidales bacterium]